MTALHRAAAGARAGMPVTPDPSRRTLLKVAGSAGAAMALSAAAGAPASAAREAVRTRVHVLVTDGLRPDGQRLGGRPSPAHRLPWEDGLIRPRRP